MTKDLAGVASVAEGMMYDIHHELTEEDIEVLESSISERDNEDIVSDIISWESRRLTIYLEDKDNRFRGTVTLLFNGSTWNVTSDF